jgi:hypothetical protein
MDYRSINTEFRRQKSAGPSDNFKIENRVKLNIMIDLSEIYWKSGQVWRGYVLMAPGASNHTGRPNHKLRNLKKRQLLDFHLFRSILGKFLERRKSIFHLKYSFCRPLNSAARGGRTTRLTTTTPTLPQNDAGSVAGSVCAGGGRHQLRHLLQARRSYWYKNAKN